MYAQIQSVTPRLRILEDTNDLVFLDDVYNLIVSGDVSRALSILRDELYNIYVSTSSSDWKHLVGKYLLQHPLFNLLMQDPLTARSFNKPRGHSGDAVLLDMIYFPGEYITKDISTIGTQIYKYTSRTQVCRSLNDRMNSVSKIIDSVCREKTMPRILSVASGHCRECDTSEAVKNKLIGKFLALDSDELTVEYLKTKSDMLGITPIHASVVDLIKGKIDLGSFDLIYSSGLYDYLSTGIAKRLTNKLYNMLDHGGKLVIFNIEPDYKEIGYIESFMNWEMIGRDEQDLLELISEIDGLEIATVKIHSQGKHSSHFNSISIKKL